jgi:hypothetical protein
MIVVKNMKAEEIALTAIEWMSIQNSVFRDVSKKMWSETSSRIKDIIEFEKEKTYISITSASHMNILPLEGQVRKVYKHHETWLRLSDVIRCLTDVEYKDMQWMLYPYIIDSLSLNSTRNSSRI